MTDGQTDRLTDVQTDRRTESDAYEPTVQYAQVGSKNNADIRYYRKVSNRAALPIEPPAISRGDNGHSKL